MGGGIVICKFGNMRLNKDLKKKKLGDFSVPLI